MIALKLFFATYGKWFKLGAWALLAVMVLSAWFYVSHLQNTRDYALKEVAGLQKTLADERTAAKALADAKVETAKAASTVAATQVVQKKREIEQSNKDLKEEIKHAYATRTSETARSDALPSGRDYAAGGFAKGEEIAAGRSAGTLYTSSAIGMGGTQGRGVGGFVEPAGSCFGGDFGRLWNAANASAGGVSSAAAP